MTYVEVLVAIVLLGTTVIGVLTATRTTIIGTTIERDHSRAEQWLQSAIGVLDGIPLKACELSLDPTGSQIVDNYELAVRAGATRPFGWNSSAQIEVLGPGNRVGPQVWDGNAFVDYDSQTACYDVNELRQQLIQIRVTSPDGKIVEDVEVIKRDI